TLTMVVKRLQGLLAREALIYQCLVAEHAHDITPRLLAVDHQGDACSVLYLERVRPVRRWPWRNPAAAEEMVGRLARLHLATAAANAAASLPPWDYEAVLKSSSEKTLELLAQCRRDPDFSPLARHMSSVRLLTVALPAMRRELLSFSPFTSVAIHGDVHPGNVLVRRRAGGEESIFIDWGRARRGSPLEDLSGWLQSLAYWEPQARRRHDTLLACYLSALGMERRLSSDLRAAYWLAGASNALSGALEYHLSIVFDQKRATALRKAAAQSASDWLRIIRRAAAFWR
ncbi:MAG: phosphotransferase, partial [Deltaproteobacteria bacterium]|nr:phosphotransferase [Deltaproteobacteria bacterium]